MTNPLLILYIDSSGTALKQTNGTIILVALYQQLVRYFRVSLGHLQVCVSHLSLKGEEITAVFQIEGSKTVTDLVGSELYTDAITILSEISSQHIRLQLLAVSCGKQ